MKKILLCLFGFGLIAQSEGCGWLFGCCRESTDISIEEVNINTNESVNTITMPDLIREIQTLTQQTHILKEELIRLIQKCELSKQNYDDSGHNRIKTKKSGPNKPSQLSSQKSRLTKRSKSNSKTTKFFAKNSF